MQSEEPLVHLLYQSTSKLLHSLLSRVVLPEVISAADDLLEIDLEDSSNLRDSNVKFIGMTTKQYARSNDMIGTYVYKVSWKLCKAGIDALKKRDGLKRYFICISFVASIDFLGPSNFVGGLGDILFLQILNFGVPK